MKKQILFLIGLIAANVLLAQVPQGISHQAVIRDTNNELVVNSPIGIQVSILQGSADGEAVYVETHSPISNANGLITYIIGEGDVVEGLFEEIDWSDGPYWLETKADPEGGTDYSIEGITSFWSVPFAMHSGDSVELFDLVEDILEHIEALQRELKILQNLAGFGTLKDIDGNTYRTIKIGTQTWMTENLRTTCYANGDNILTDLSDELWGNITIGAYAIYPHENAGGINSEEEMVEAYGKMYNWYAVDDSRGLCPEGWRVPSDADWTALVNYLNSQGFPNEWNNLNGAGNALKSCRQIGSPLEGCNTSEHPRWNSHSTHYGFDKFGFTALPGGRRWSNGSFSSIGDRGLWWSAIEFGGTTAWSRSIGSDSGSMYRSTSTKRDGLSVRCLRDHD